MSSTDSIVVDAGVLINLLAGNQAIDMLAQLPYRFVTTPNIFKQRFALWSSDGDHKQGAEEASNRETVDGHVLVQNGLLEVRDAEDCEQEFASLAVYLSDSQAKIVAVCLAMGGGIATDDIRTRRVLQELDLRLPQYSTLSLLREWYALRSGNGSQIREVARAISSRAQYYPAVEDPLYSWWLELI